MIARACCEWALSEMQTPGGGFASSQDADSEGEEGRFFVFTRAELDDILGSELATIAAAYFDVREEGNFEAGKSVLWRPGSAELCAEALAMDTEALETKIAVAKQKLRAARELRTRPSTDDKVLVSWNALMISALAQAHQVLDEPRYLHATERALGFIWDTMRGEDGRLFATARAGRAQHPAGLDDHAFLVAALLDLYESSFDPEHVRRALTLCEVIERDFGDAERGGYFTTRVDQEHLLARLPSFADDALPAGASVHALNLLRLAELTSREALRERALRAMRAVAALASRHPHAFPQLMLALDFLETPPRTVVIVGEPQREQTQALLRAVRRTFRPQRTVLLAEPARFVQNAELFPVAQEKSAGDSALAYVCRDFTCLAPVSDARALREFLRQGTAPTT